MKRYFPKNNCTAADERLRCRQADSHRVCIWYMNFGFHRCEHMIVFNAFKNILVQIGVRLAALARPKFSSSSHFGSFDFSEVLNATDRGGF